MRAHNAHAHLRAYLRTAPLGRNRLRHDLGRFVGRLSKRERRLAFKWDGDGYVSACVCVWARACLRTRVHRHGVVGACAVVAVWVWSGITVGRAGATFLAAAFFAGAAFCNCVVFVLRCARACASILRCTRARAERVAFSQQPQPAQPHRLVLICVS